MSSALDQFLGDAEPAQAVVPEPVSQEPEITAEAAHEEASQEELPREESYDLGTKDTKEAKGLRSALLSERHRRQEADEKLKQIEQKLKELEMRPSVQQQMPVKDDLEITEEEIYADLPGTVKKLEQRFDRRLQNERFEMSETMARLRYDDYEQVIGKYVEAVKENPSIFVAVQQSRAPALEMYNLTKGHLESKKAISPEKIDEIVDLRVEKRLQEELAKRGLSQAAQIPPSLAAARGSGSSKREETSHELSLKEIMDSRKKRR